MLQSEIHNAVRRPIRQKSIYTKPICQKSIFQMTDSLNSPTDNSLEASLPAANFQKINLTEVVCQIIISSNDQFTVLLRTFWSLHFREVLIQSFHDSSLMPYLTVSLGRTSNFTFSRFRCQALLQCPMVQYSNVNKWWASS